MHILIVEDDRAMVNVLTNGLREEAHEVEVAVDGRTALRLSGGASFDLVVLDVMLPGMDGLAVDRQLRLRRNSAPVLLTARDVLPDIVAGLDAGADDYLTKPFFFEELLARIRALQRRAVTRTKTVLDSAI